MKKIMFILIIIFAILIIIGFLFIFLSKDKVVFKKNNIEYVLFDGRIIEKVSFASKKEAKNTYEDRKKYSIVNENVKVKGKKIITEYEYNEEWYSQVGYDESSQEIPIEEYMVNQGYTIKESKSLETKIYERKVKNLKQPSSREELLELFDEEEAITLPDGTN